MVGTVRHDKLRTPRSVLTARRDSHPSAGQSVGSLRAADVGAVGANLGDALIWTASDCMH